MISRSKRFPSDETMLRHMVNSGPWPENGGVRSRGAPRALDPGRLPGHCSNMSEETDLSSLSFEDALRRLEAIVQQLESGDVPLDQSITLYAEGDRLRAQCQKRLADAQARIEKITLGSDGSIDGTEPFGAD